MDGRTSPEAVSGTARRLWAPAPACGTNRYADRDSDGDTRADVADGGTQRDPDGDADSDRRSHIASFIHGSDPSRAGFGGAEHMSTPELEVMRRQALL